MDEVYDYIHVDGIHLGRKSVVLIAYSGKHVLGWYVARSENSRAWGYLMQRIAEPLVVVCDGSGGIRKAVKTYWPNTKIQRCLFHIGLNIKALTGVNPRLTPGKQLLSLANIVSDIKTEDQARHWLISYNNWVNTWSDFLKEKSKYCDGSIADTHQRLVRAKSMIDRRIREGYMFTFLNPPGDCNHPIPPTNNAIESMNGRIRAMLRNHRGLSLLKRIHAICWWCYLNTSKPRDKSWIVTHSFTSKRIEQLYRQAWERSNQGLSEDHMRRAIEWWCYFNSENPSDPKQFITAECFKPKIKKNIIDDNPIGPVHLDTGFDLCKADYHPDISIRKWTMR